MSKRFVDNRFEFVKDVVAGSRNCSRAGAAEWRRSTAGLANCSARRSSINISRRIRRPRWNGLVGNLKSAPRRASRATAGCPRDQGGGAREAEQDGRDGRLSGQIPRLFSADDRRRTTSTATSSANRIRVGIPAERISASRSTQEVGHEPGDGRCLQWRPGEQDRVPGRHPAGAVVRSGGGPAVNYGAIGAVIGHEIMHGFDDQGRKIDQNGAVRDWWTAEDAARSRR